MILCRREYTSIYSLGVNSRKSRFQRTKRASSRKYRYWGAYWVLRLRSIFSGTCFFSKWTITDSGIPDSSSSWLGHDEHDVLSDSEFPSPLKTDRSKPDCNHLLFRHALDLCSSFGVYSFFPALRGPRNPLWKAPPVMEAVPPRFTKQTSVFGRVTKGKYM